MSLSIHAKRRIFYVKTEGGTPGTYVSTVTLFAIGNATVPPENIKGPNFTVDFTERKVDGNSLQPLKAVAGAQIGKVSLTTRLIGPPTKGVAGPLSDMFKSAGLSEVLVATTSATFKEDPSSQARLSIGVGMIQEDGLLEVEWALSGCAASKLDIKGDGIGKPVMCDWEFTGKPAYATGTLIAVDDATPNAGITFVDDDTQGFKFMKLSVTSGLTARQINNFVFSRGLPVDMDTDIADPSGHGWAKFGQTDPQVKLDPTKVPVATSNDVANLIAGATASAGFTLTNAAGATFAMAFPNLQPVALSDDARGNVSTWGITAHCRKSQTGVAVDASDAFTFIFA